MPGSGGTLHAGHGRAHRLVGGVPTGCRRGRTGRRLDRGRRLGLRRRARALLNPGDRSVAPRSTIPRGRAHGPTVSSLHDLPLGSGTRDVVPRRIGERTTGAGPRDRRVRRPPRCAVANARRRQPADPGPGPTSPAVRQSSPMDYRRGGRPPQVRPRPASFGRPVPPADSGRPPRPRPDWPGIVGSTAGAGCRRRSRRVSRPGSSPSASGSCGWPAARSGRSSAASSTASAGSWRPSARPSAAPRPRAAPPTSDAPSIVTPAEPYTNDDAVDVTVNVPQDVVGDAQYTLRLYVAVGDAEPDPARRAADRADSVQLIPSVALEQGPQRVPGVDRRAGRRERAVGHRHLGPRHLEAEAHDHLARGRLVDQQGQRHDQGQDAGRQLGPAQERRQRRDRDGRRQQGRPVRGQASASRPGSTPSRSRPSTRQATPTTRPSRSARARARRRPS